MNLTALDRRGTAEGSADRLGQGLGAVDDEEPRHRRVEPALDQIIDEGLAFLCGITTPSLSAQGGQRRFPYFNIERDNSHQRPAMLF